MAFENAFEERQACNAEKFTHLATRSTPVSVDLQTIYVRVGDMAFKTRQQEFLLGSHA